MHSGGHELLPPGDPARGGRPPETFSYVATVPEQFQPVYHAAREQLGKLEHELALARTNLYRYQQRFEEQQKGGIPTSVSGGGASVSIRPYADVVGEYLDRIARLEERRARILKTLQELDDPPLPPGFTQPLVATDGADEDVTDNARQRLREKLLRDGD